MMHSFTCLSCDVLLLTRWRFVLVFGIFEGFGDEGIGPASVLVDHFVDFAHQPNRLADGDDHLLVVLNVFLGQLSTRSRILATFGLPVFEPFLYRLVAANIKVQRLSGTSEKKTD